MLSPSLGGDDGIAFAKNGFQVEPMYAGKAQITVTTGAARKIEVIDDMRCPPVRRDTGQMLCKNDEALVRKEIEEGLVH